MTCVKLMLSGKLRKWEGHLMRILRYILLASSLGGFAYIIYGLRVYRSSQDVKVIVVAIGIATVLNFIYILLCAPDRKTGSRLRRLWSLWLDAKERELKERAGKPPQSN